LRDTWFAARIHAFRCTAFSKVEVALCR
jgi:hypothetical protein